MTPSGTGGFLRRFCEQTGRLNEPIVGAAAALPLRKQALPRAGRIHSQRLRLARNSFLCLHISSMAELPQSISRVAAAACRPYATGKTR